MLRIRTIPFILLVLASCGAEPWADDTMPWPTPPRGWEMATGTWATDADRDESTTFSGSYSVLLKDTAVATKIRSPWVAVEQDLASSVSVLLQTDDITAGYTITVAIEQYEADRVTLDTTTTVFSAVLSATNTWEWVNFAVSPSSSNVRWYRVAISKTTNTHNVYIDNVIVDRWQPSWFLPRALGGTQSISSGTWTTVAFDAIGLIHRITTASGVVTAPFAGVYSVASSVEFEAFSDGTEVDIRIKAVANSSTDYYYGQKITVGGAHTVRLTVSAAAVVLLREGTIEIEVWHNEGSAVNVTPASGSDRRTIFTGHRIGKI